MKTTARFWMGSIATADDFGEPITTAFIDGRTKYGPWAVMTPLSWGQHGIGRLGTGFGQRYEKQADGQWLKVEG